MAVIQQQDWAFIGSETKGFVAFTTQADRIDLVPTSANPGSKTNILKVENYEVVKWGATNQLPVELLALVSSNHMKPQILKTLRDLSLGAGLLFYRRVVDGKKKYAEPADFKDGYTWLDDVDAYDVIARAALAYFYSGQGFYTAKTDVSSGKVIEIESQDFTYCRVGKIPKGKSKPQTLYLHPTWKAVKKDDVVGVPIWQFPDSFNDVPRDFAYIAKDGTPGNAYYDLPDYFGSQNWTLIANLISAWHLSGLKNGYNLRHVIHIPANYFEKFGDKAKEKEEEFKVNMDEFLAGVDNVNKALLMKFATDAEGKPIQGFKIETIAPPGGDDMYLALEQRATIAQVSAHGINPSLAGADTGGKLFGSGTELRIAYQLHLAMRTPRVRHILLSFFNRIVRKLNNWPEGVLLGFEDVNLTTIADNPNGAEKVQNSAL